MALPCPYVDGWETPTYPNEPHKEVADLFQHLGEEHHEDQKELFSILSGMMRNLPIPNRTP